MARSEDGGRSWQPAKPIPLRNPNAKMNILRLSNGALAAAFNNHGSEEYKRRSLMTVSISVDDGTTWKVWDTSRELCKLCSVSLQTHPNQLPVAFGNHFHSLAPPVSPRWCA